MEVGVVSERQTWGEVEDLIMQRVRCSLESWFLENLHQFCYPRNNNRNWLLFPTKRLELFGPSSFENMFNPSCYIHWQIPNLIIFSRSALFLISNPNHADFAPQYICMELCLQSTDKTILQGIFVCNFQKNYKHQSEQKKYFYNKDNIRL